MRSKAHGRQTSRFQPVMEFGPLISKMALELPMDYTRRINWHAGQWCRIYIFDIHLDSFNRGSQPSGVVSSARRTCVLPGRFLISLGSVAPPAPPPDTPFLQ